VHWFFVTPAPEVMFLLTVEVNFFNAAGGKVGIPIVPGGKVTIPKSARW